MRSASQWSMARRARQALRRGPSSTHRLHMGGLRCSQQDGTGGACAGGRTAKGFDPHASGPYCGQNQSCLFTSSDFGRRQCRASHGTAGAGTTGGNPPKAKRPRAEARSVRGTEESDRPASGARRRRAGGRDRRGARRGHEPRRQRSDRGRRPRGRRRRRRHHPSGRPLRRPGALLQLRRRRRRGEVLRHEELRRRVPRRLRRMRRLLPEQEGLSPGGRRDGLQQLRPPLPLHQDQRARGRLQPVADRAHRGRPEAGARRPPTCRPASSTSSDAGLRLHRL